MKSIPYGKQSINEEDIQAVVEVLRSDRLTQGPKVQAFEKALCDLTGAKHCVALANGTMALHLACLALGVGPGDHGITSPISFLASANCIAYCGGTPDFADIDPNTLCLSPDEVEKKCQEEPAPKVVIPVDFAGVPADLPRFRRLSEKYGFSLIEDAAHAIGSTYTVGGKTYDCGSCAHTDLAIFSFHPVKTITTGEGGAVLTNNDEWAHKLELLANHGIERDPKRFVTRHSPPAWYHEMHLSGYNGRITDIQCALGLSQIRRLDEFKARRQSIAKRYNKALLKLKNDEVVFLPPWPTGNDPCFHLYPLRLGPGCKIQRDELFTGLREKGIYCQVHYIPIYRQPFFREHYGLTPNAFPGAEEYFSSCLSLPLYPDLSEDSYRYVIDTLIALLTSGNSQIYYKRAKRRLKDAQE